MRILTILSYLFYLCISLNGNSQTITVQNLDDSGIGSLRNAISNANSGDTIRFNPMLIAQGSDTLVLDTVINIDKDLVINGLYDSEDTLFLSSKTNRSIFFVDSVDNILLDSLCLLADTSDNIDPYITYFVYSNVLVSNCFFKGYTKIILHTWQSNLTIVGSMVLGLHSPQSFPKISYATQGDIFRECNITNSVFKLENSNSTGFYIETGGNKINNNIHIENSYFSNFKTLIYGLNTVNVVKNTFNNSLIKTGEPNRGFYTRNIALTVKASTFTITDSNRVQNTILSIGTPYGPIEPIPLDTIKLNFTNCTFNGGLYEDTLYGSFTDSNYLDYFGPDLDELKITSCIFNDINGFNELPIDSSGGYNLFSFPQNIGLDSTDQTNVLVSDINLGPLQNNGGYTPTHLPNYQSLAFNSGNPNDTSSAQNGAIIQRRDIGSAEIQAVLTIDTTEHCGTSYNWRADTLTETDIHFDFEESTTGGHDSVFALDLTLDYMDALAISDGGALQANITDASYQWIDCSTHLPLFGETNQTLTPNIAGTYAVVVSNGICTDTSACVFIDNLSVEEHNPNLPLIRVTNQTIFFNPSNSLLSHYIIYNSQGQSVVSGNVKSGEINLSNFPSGLYSIQFKDATMVRSIKFVLN